MHRNFPGFSACDMLSRRRTQWQKSAKIIEIKGMMEEPGLIIIKQVSIEPLIALREELKDYRRQAV
jgi:hypothetical protein